MMYLGGLEVTLSASWVHSLKEKRMIVRSLVAKIRQTFNVSVHEINRLDEHQTIVLGITTASNNKAQIHALFEQVITFIESNFDTSIDEIEMDIF